MRKRRGNPWFLTGLPRLLSGLEFIDYSCLPVIIRHAFCIRSPSIATDDCLRIDVNNTDDKYFCNINQK